MKMSNPSAAQRGRKREFRTKPGSGRTTKIELKITESDAEALRYLERERKVSPEEVLQLGLRYSGI